MTATGMETRKPVLRLIKIKDGNCYLNADPDKPIPLAHEWQVSDLLPLITAYATEYDIDIINERHVQTIVNRTVLELGDSKGKVNNLLLDKEAPDAEKRAFLVGEVTTRRTYRTLEDTGEILYREHGVFKAGGREKMLADLQDVGGYDVTNTMRNEVVNTVRAQTYTPRSEFDKDPDIRNLVNGFFNIRTGEFVEHDDLPDYLSVVQMPVKYDPKATCRPIIEALYNTFENPQDVPLFLEWLAYDIFWRNKDLQKEGLLVGPPECGKSRVLDIIIRLLGSENVSAVTFQQLTTNRFAKAQLFGKLANIYADITHTRVEDIEAFKAIATADEVEAEKKGLQLFKFRPTAKLTYSCNIPPKPPLNVDDSFYRRWILIKCAWRETDYFTGAPRTRDRKVLDKLATPENLSGLLNLAIVSAHRLLKKERFCREEPTDEIRAEYGRLSNPVKLWTEECCEEVDDDEPDACVTKQEAHANYVKFCKVRNIAPLNEVWLGKELAALGYTERQLGKGRDRKRVWNGLKLKEVTGRASFPSLMEGQTSLVEQGKDPLPVTSQEEF